MTDRRLILHYGHIHSRRRARFEAGIAAVVAVIASIPTGKLSTGIVAISPLSGDAPRSDRPIVEGDRAGPGPTGKGRRGDRSRQLDRLAVDRAQGRPLQSDVVVRERRWWRGYGG